MNRIVVRIADYKVSESPSILVTFGLGSCVAVSLYDPVKRVGGLSHIMLPKNIGPREPGNPLKYADLCIAAMLNEMLKIGCVSGRLVSKIAGGASMFDLPGKEAIPIGQRNRDTSLEELQKLKIPLVAEDTGGNHGRTVELDLANGNMQVKSLVYGSKTI